MNRPLRILFVCHGNICRSPMAEFIMKNMVAEKGLSDRFEIASCATSSEELGNPVYPPAKKVLSDHGIQCTDRRARRMTAEDYARFDLIFAMDRNNLRNMKDRIGNDPDKKVKLLTSCVGKDSDVSDPWYSGDFEGVFSDISEACYALLKSVNLS